MSIIYILIPIAALLTALGVYLFFWAVKAEQFDDLEKQGMSILFDEDKEKEKENNKAQVNNDEAIKDNVEQKPYINVANKKYINK